jgi:membrane protease YdiL (CAAX protease family)
MYFVDKENLFIIVRKNPALWILVVLFYSVFSVYPQEFLYRTFYFARYNKLFSNKKVLIIINAIVFSMAHLVFRNFLVLGLTLVGGLVFAITYNKSKSLTFTCLEHAIYGSWLFTVGMGEMLAFPLPE